MTRRLKPPEGRPAADLTVCNVRNTCCHDDFQAHAHARCQWRRPPAGFAVWQRCAGFDRHVSFRTLRHSACSAIYRKTKDIRLTQRFARHKSILTTAFYSHPTDEDLLRAVTGLPC